MWFFEQLYPGTSVHSFGLAFDLHGPLDIPALQTALDAIAARHELLRTSICVRDGEPYGLVNDRASMPLERFDVRSQPPSQRLAAALDICRLEAMRPYDLAQAPLARAALVHIDDGRHMLMLGAHHLVRDRATVGIMNREVGAAYGAALRGEPPESAMPKLAVQWADYVRWSRALAGSGAYDRQRRYWKDRLAGATPLLALPTDRPRSSQPLHRREGIEVVVGDVAAPRALARRHDASLLMTVTAAVQALLYRMSGRDDLLTGFLASLRTHPALDGLVGCFANTVVLRTHPNAGMTFGAFLDQVRDAARAAYDHRDLPFEQAVEIARHPRDLGYPPVVQVLTTIIDHRIPALALDGITVEEHHLDSNRPAADLFFEFRELGSELLCRLCYDTELFERATAEAMVGSLRRLIEAAIENPELPLGRLPLATSEQRRAVLSDWNPGMRDASAEGCLHRAFAAVAAHRPAAVAVRHGEEQITYGELNARANQLARWLQAHGVGLGSRVGICAERSVGWIAGALAVLKTGAAYVPLDPQHPSARLRFLASDAKMAALIADGRTARRIDAGLPAIDPDRHAEHQSETGADGDVDACTGAASPAYLIYTSGSSGKPKGVVISHAAASRTVVAPSFVDVGPTDVIAGVCNAAFDVAVFEIWGALANGAQLTIVPNDVLLEPRGLAALFERDRVSIAALPTAVFNEIARVHPAAFGGLRYVLVAGEAMSPDPVRAVLERGAPEHLINAYGPTEACVFATTFEVRSVVPGQSSIPIGRPIADTSAYVLDESGEIVPPCVPGELHIGGPRLALEYFGRPELSRERFVSDRFAGDGKLYRTGDVARFRADGTLEFLGRIDRQIKLRGYRIEPEEIEAVLLSHPSVRAAAVDADRERTSLVAYVTPRNRDAVSANELHAFLARQLPAYMLPRIELVEALAITANGKVDRQALAAAGPSDGARRVPSDGSPRTAGEAVLLEIWRSLLGRDDISVHDDFFALGGHSLMAMQMMVRVEQRYGRPVPISALFANATIRSLADYLCDSIEEAPLVLPLRADGSQPPLFFFHGDLRHGGLFCRHLVRAVGSEQPFYAVGPFGLNGTPGPQSIEAAARAYLPLLRAVRPRGPYRLAGFCQGAFIAFEVARQLQAQGERVERLVVIDAQLRPELVAIDAPLRFYARLRRLAPYDERKFRRRAYRLVQLFAAPIAEAPRAMRALKRLVLRPTARARTARVRDDEQAGRTRSQLADALFVDAVEIAENYVPKRYAGSFTLILATRAAGGGERDARRWRALTSARVMSRTICDNHLGIVTSSIDELARHLCEALRDG